MTSLPSSEMQVVLNMVVRNEERRIGPMLAMTMPLVDHAIVVVQESEDLTLDICRAMGCEVIEDEGRLYGDPSRPLAFEATPAGAWVLMLDADEFLLPQFSGEMRTLEDRGFLGARLIFSNWVSGEHHGDGDPHLRFCRRDHLRVPSTLHEQPAFIGDPDAVYRPTYPGVLHCKTWVECIQGERGYKELLTIERASFAPDHWDQLWALSRSNLDRFEAQGRDEWDVEKMFIRERQRDVFHVESAWPNA